MRPSGVAIDAKCQESFNRQGFMQLLGAQLLEAADGRAVIEVPYREDLSQQHGYLHGGVVSAIADTAGGYAAYTSMPADASVLTIEFKIKTRLLATVSGQKQRSTRPVAPWSSSERRSQRSAVKRPLSAPRCSAPSSSCATPAT